ncbi:hypothetical protein ACWDTG_06875 [Rhodococcus zopfii]
MNDIDAGAAADRAHEILLDTELGVAPAVYRHPGPTWVCPDTTCGKIRSAACGKPACGSDQIDRRDLKSYVRGFTLDDDNDPIYNEDGWEE